MEVHESYQGNVVLITRGAEGFEWPFVPGYVISKREVERVGFPLENTTMLEGGLLARKEFPELYEVVGRKFSHYDDNPDMFRVPDIRGRTVITDE